jgi:Rab-like protein 2
MHVPTSKFHINHTAYTLRCPRDRFFSPDSNKAPAAEAPAPEESKVQEAPQKKKDADLKIILLGDSAVGKSKLVERFLMSDFDPQQDSTFALTVFRHTAQVEGKGWEIDFWDTAGQERFASMHPSYYHRADACILVFDIGRKITYQHLKQWHAELEKYRKDIPVIVVANKIDSRPEAAGQPFAFATKRKLPLMYSSASNGMNVVQVFEQAIQLAVAAKQKEPEDFYGQVLETIDYLDQKQKERAEEKTAAETKKEQEVAAAAK